LGHVGGLTKKFIFYWVRLGVKQKKEPLTHVLSKKKSQNFMLKIVLFLSILKEIYRTVWIKAIAKSVPKLLRPKVWPF